MKHFLAILLFFSFTFSELSDTVKCVFDLPSCEWCDMEAEEEQDEQKEQNEKEEKAKKEIEEKDKFFHSSFISFSIAKETSIEKVKTTYEAQYPTGISCIHTPPPEMM